MVEEMVPPNESRTKMNDEELRRKVLVHELTGLGIVVGLGTLVIILLVGLILLKNASIEKKRREDEQNRTPVSVNVVVSRIKAQTVVDSIRLPGMLEAWDDVDIPAEVSGTVLASSGDNHSALDGEVIPAAVEGQVVKKGDVIVRIDPTDYRIARDRAAAAFKLAEATVKRTRQLAASYAVNRQQLDEDESAFRQAKAELEAAALNLTRCEIRSPIDGIVNQIVPDEGEFVSAGSVVATVVNTALMKVEVGIPERDVDAVRNLKEADLTVTALGADYRTRGQCSFLSTKPIGQALVYLMRLRIDNPDGRLRPGMFAEAVVVRRVTPNGVLVPMFSVVPRDESHYVYVADVKPAEGGSLVLQPGKAVERKVTIGSVQGTNIEIVSGVAPGENLIVLGQRSVADGSPVTVMREADDPAELLR